VPRAPPRAQEWDALRASDLRFIPTSREDKQSGKGGRRDSATVAAACRVAIAGAVGTGGTRARAAFHWHCQWQGRVV
jgi:hypothetical protein